MVIFTEMTTSIRFCLSYNRFKQDIIAFKEDTISIENVTLSRTSLLRYAYAEKLCNVWSYHFLLHDHIPFYDMMLSIE